MSNWNEDLYKAAYLSHIRSLTDLCDHAPPHGQELFAHIQYELLKEARYVLLSFIMDRFLIHSSLQAYMRVSHSTL
jgi:hypothetical protein